MAVIEINQFIKSFESAFGKPKSDIREVINAYYSGQDYSGMADAVQIVDAYVLYGDSIKPSFFQKTVQHMKDCGWQESFDGDNIVIFHENTTNRYENWEDAIKACIEVASGV